MSDYVPRPAANAIRSRDIPESDWRQFKKLHPILLQRFCQRTLDELARVIDSPKGTFHDRYLKAYKLMGSRDRELGRIFDDYRRSTAIMQLTNMRLLHLLTNEELHLLSEETQRIIKSLDGMREAGSDHDV